MLESHVGVVTLCNLDKLVVSRKTTNGDDFHSTNQGKGRVGLWHGNHGSHGNRRTRLRGLYPWLVVFAILSVGGDLVHQLYSTAVRAAVIWIIASSGIS